MKEQEKTIANTDDIKMAENTGSAENNGGLAGSAEAMNSAENNADRERNEPERSDSEKTAGKTETGEVEKTNGGRPAAPKKRGWRGRLGNLLLIGGIVIICIPFIGRYLADRQQQQMLKEFYDQMDINDAIGTEAEKLNQELGYTDDATLQGDLDASAKAIREIEQSEGLDPHSAAKLTTGPTAIGIIEIPKIKLKYPVAEGVDNATLRFCIGHMPQTAGLGENGNSVLAGHRSHSFGDFFNRLDELENGDSIVINTKSGSTAYTVYEKKRVNKKDISVLSQKNKTDKVVTLITCELGINPEERIIVKAKAAAPAESPAKTAEPTPAAEQ